MVPRCGLPDLKGFVRGSCTDSEQGNPNPQKLAVTECLSGLDARQAYEDIVSNRFDSPPRNVMSKPFQEEPEALAPTRNPVTKRQPTKTQSVPRRGDFNVTLVSLMKHIEQNDCKKVMDDLNNSSNLLNAVDQFGWSPLMVAACAGALEVVKLLLKSGADTKLRDRAGATCISLARKRGHHHVIKAIKSFSSKILEPEVEKIRRPSASPKRQLCTACNVSIAESSRKNHLTSTVHQLSQCTNGCKTYYSIPPSNRGYQMMLRSGWDREEGLGPSGSGTKYPPKTTLKRDRKGLGVSKQQARITHFQSNDLKAIAQDSTNRNCRSSKEHKNKAQLNQQIQNEKLKERSIRWQLN